MNHQENSHISLTRVEIFYLLILSLRPKQWTKNFLIYFAFFFTINERWNLANTHEAISLLGKSTVAFILFTMISGAIYLINDIFDIDKDIQHKNKKLRPIASGRLPIAIAWYTVAVLTILGLIFSFTLESTFGWITLGYMILMLAYTLVLKHLVILDVLTISAGFVIRATAGAAVLQLPISPWLYTCTGLGALLIALVKRRSELILSGNKAVKQRYTLKFYTTNKLDHIITFISSSAILIYILYTFTASNLPQNHTMIITIPFVIYGILRYVYLAEVKNVGENPEDVLTRDIPLMISIAMWLFTAGSVLIIFRG